MAKAKKKHHIQEVTKRYIRILAQVREYLDNFEGNIEPTLEKALQHAKEVNSHLGDMTQEEAELITNSLKRDLYTAGHFMQQTGLALRDWLAFDWRLIEDRLWSHFSKVADKTRLDLQEFTQELEQHQDYHAGEIIGLGT